MLAIDRNVVCVFSGKIHGMFFPDFNPSLFDIIITLIACSEHEIIKWKMPKVFYKVII